MQTRDLTTIIVMAVLQFVITVLIAQMGTIITGIPGTNFLFTILLAIPITFSLLTYEGRRWRIFMQLALFVLLAIPTRLGGPAFDPISRLGSLTSAFLIDIIANSLYGQFKKREKLLWWAVIVSGIYWCMIPLFSTVTKILFYTPDTVERFIGIVSLLFPVIIAEALIGGYIGYQIYKRRIKL